MKFKFTTFLKIFGICFGSLIGVLGITLGIMKLAGAMDEPKIYPTAIYFQDSTENTIDTYNVDDNFKVTIMPSTDDVTMKDLTLDIITSGQVTEKDGKITDGIITIPKTAKIGEPFEVILNKVINDRECNGLEWIVGGHTVIRATSQGDSKQGKQECSAKLNINIDVPVYKIEVETRVSSTDANSNAFVINSIINASLKFYPERSAYQFSQNGENGYSKIYKNAYFVVESLNDTKIEQQGYTNQFLTKDIGTSTIVGYCFKSAVKEQEILKLQEGKAEDVKRNNIMEELKNGLASDSPTSLKNTKTFTIENINVDSITVDSDIKNVYVDTIKRLYANKSLLASDLSSSLGIKLISTNNPNVSLQNKLNNVGIRFLIMNNGQYEDCVNNSNEDFNIIKMPEDSFSTQAVYQGNTYYKPVITNNVDDYFWDFVVNSNYADTIYIEIAYLDEDVNITPQKLSFKLYEYSSENVSWNLSTSQKDITIKIFDNEDENLIEYKEFDLKPYVSVPDRNLYKTIKYFVYFDSDRYNNVAVEELIDCKPGVTYSIGSQTLNLYELEDGVIKAKSLLAHGLTFSCIFTTVQADYLGQIKLDENGKYIIDQYSKERGVLDFLNVNVQKTLKSFKTSLEYNGTKDDLKALFVNNTTTKISKFAFVQSLGEAVNYFDIAITQFAKDNTEKEIFRQAIRNNEINVIVKLDGQEQVPDSSTLPLITFRQLIMIEENDMYKQKYSVYVSELVERAETKLEFYVRYQLADGVYKDYPIECKFNKANNILIEDQIADYIEIYSGEAQTFDFNLNLKSPTSETNRVVISSDIVADNGIVKRIDRTFKLNGKDVQEDLFVVNGEGVNKEITSKVNIIMKDKYGRLPIKYSYKLESSDSNIMVVNGDTFTLVDTDKDVNLILKKDGMDDRILYIHAGKSGRVSQVDFITETQDQSTLKPIWSTETVYDNTNTEQYLFDLKTITIIGAKGTEIKFNDTTENAKNLVNYMYEYQGGVASLVSQVKISLVEDLDDILDKYITFDETGIILTRNFGNATTIRLLASIPDLGISQYITLDIRPNVTVTITQPSTRLPIISGEADGPKSYFGLYSEYYYEFNVVISYSIISNSTANTDSLNYVFTVNDGRRITILTKNTDVARLYEDTVIPDIDEKTGKREFTVRIYFDSFSESQKKMTLSFGAHTDDKEIYDAYADLYLYVTPNINVQLTSNTLYLDYQNTPSGQTTITGTKDIYGNSSNVIYPISLTRILGNTQFSNNIVFELKDGTSGYEISNYTLRCLKQLSSVEEISIIVKYNDCPITTISLNVAPHIEMNNENNDWVLYDGEYYLKLVNNQTYDFDKIKAMFNFDSNGQVADLNITENIYVSKTDSLFEVKGVNYALISTNDNDEKLRITVLLDNGNSLTFNVMLFPVDMPFVNYENGSLGDVDLVNLLNSDWLIENGYFTSIKSTGDDGVSYRFAKDDLTGTNYGVQLIETDSVRYTLYTNDAEYASLLENGNIRIIPAGEEKYVTIFVNLNPLVSNSLIIPYVLRIEKELSLKVFYPYLNGVSDMGQLDSQILASSSSKFEREYLSVDSSYKTSINLLEKQESFVPNKSQDSKRVAIYLNDNEYSGTSKGAEIKFKVSKVLFSTVEGGMFFTVENKDSFAYFSAGNNSGVLNINTKGYKQLRIEIEISTEGLVGYYYISIGETPNLKAYKLASDQTITDIEIKAGETQELNYALQEIITSGNSTITKDATQILQYYAYDESAENEHITIEKNEDTYSISTEECTNNWTAKLMLYTIYGKLLNININVQSNYIVKAKERIITDNTTIDINSFSAYKYSNVDNDFTDEISNFDISEISITSNEKHIENILIDGNRIEIGAVKEAFDITFDISFNLGNDNEGNTITYTNEYTFTINPQLFLNKINSQEISLTNKFEVADENIVTNDNGSEISISLVQSNSESNVISPFVLVDRDINEWKQSNTKTQFKASIVSELPLKEYYTATNNDDLSLTIKAPLVVEKTVVTYKIEYINVLGNNEYSILTAYVVFTLNPNFKVETNYPQASSNQSSTTDEPCEYFYINDNNVQSDTISLDKQALLANDRRFIISKLNSQDPNNSDYVKDNVYIQVSGYNNESTKVYVNNSRENIVKENTFYSFDTRFGFSSSEEQDSVRFTVYLKIEGQYFEIGYYLAQISNNLSNVWSVNKYNFNATSPNDSNNPEQIYLGSDDKINKTVRLNIKISSSIADTSKRYYLGIKELFGISVNQSSYSYIANNATSTVDIYLGAIDFDKLQSQPFNEDITLGFSIYDENGEEINDESIKNAVKYQIISLQTRIELKYHNVVCDIDKLYKITNLSTITFSAQDNSKIKAGKFIINSENAESEIVIDSYYVNEILDVTFETTTFEVSTGNKVNLIQSEASKYDNMSAALKRISSHIYYTTQDFGNNESEISIELHDINEYLDENRTTLIEPKKGFLRVTPIASSDGNKNLDFIILAMGAPNEPVYVDVTFTIKIGNDSDDFTIKFKVSADYQNLSLLNTDLSENSESNPCTITALNDNNLQNYKTFAILSDLSLGDNLIYIEHANEIEGVVGNIIPLFKVAPDRDFDDNGYDKIHRLNDKNLTFCFDKVSFGNVKIRLIFEDDYGYTFDYYITILAIYNPVYNSGTLTFFEEDTLEIVNSASSSSGQSTNVVLPINFEKTIDSNISMSSVSIKSVSFLEASSKTYIDNFVNKINNTNLSITINSLDILSSEIQIEGTLKIELSYMNSTVILSIPSVVKALYTIKTIDDKVYVRDGVAFDMLDVIEVIDNKSSTIKIGERTLEKSDSAKVGYTLPNNMNFNKNEQFNVTFGLRARNKTTEKILSERAIGDAISNNKQGTIYGGLQDIFEITSIENYTFQLIMWDALGQLKEIKVDSSNVYITTQLQQVSIKFSKYKLVNSDELYYLADTMEQIQINDDIYQKTSGSIEYSVTLDLQLIKDQILKIGLRKIQNYDSNDITLYFENGKTLTINSDSLANKTISLVENGIIESGEYTSLLTKMMQTQSGSAIYINNGLSQDDIMKLKDIHLSLVSEAGNQDSPLYTLHLNDDDALETTIINQINVAYQQRTILVDVLYAKDSTNKTSYTKESLNHPVNINVTLKFIDVDKRFAYGSNTVKFVGYKNDGDKKIDLNTWAGTSSDDNAFMLNPGYSNAIVYNEDDLYLPNNIGNNSGNLSFSINSTDSDNNNGILNYAKIDSNTGEIELVDGFDFEKNYLAVDIYVKYGNKSTQLISTVQLAFREVSISGIAKNSSELVVENGTAKVSDILNLFNVRDTYNNYWSGSNIYKYFSKEAIYFRYSNQETNLLDMDYNNGFISNITDGSSISIVYKDTVLNGYTIANRYQSKNAVKLNISARNILLTKEIQQVIDTETQEQIYDWASLSKNDIVNDIKDYVSFIDIYGNLTGYTRIGQDIDEKGDNNTTPFVYKCNEVANSDLYHTFKITYYYNIYADNSITNSIELGTVTVIIYNIGIKEANVNIPTNNLNISLPSIYDLVDYTITDTNNIINSVTLDTANNRVTVSFNNANDGDKATLQLYIKVITADNYIVNIKAVYTFTKGI